MPDLPLVTIGAINYNNAQFVIETLESIKAQTYKNTELVIVDDCSTDTSLGLIKEWLTTYGGLYKLVEHEVNMGVCATCNDVLKNARGIYISFIATDDVMLENKTAVQVEVLKNAAKDVAVVYSDAYLIGEASELRFGTFIQKWKSFEYLPDGDIYNILMQGNFLPAMSLMVKKSCYDDVGFFDENLAYEDFDMWLRLASKYKFVSSDYVSVKYRVRQGSLMFTIKNWDMWLMKIYSKQISSGKKAIERMEDVGMRIYLSKASNITEIFRPYRHISNRLKALYIMSALKIPIFAGKRIIRVIN